MRRLSYFVSIIFVIFKTAKNTRIYRRRIILTAQSLKIELENYQQPVSLNLFTHIIFTTTCKSRV